MTTNPFSEPEERTALRKAVFALASKYGHTYVAEKAATGGKVTELWSDMGRHGFLGVSIAEEHGGGGGGVGDLAAGLEEGGAGGGAGLSGACRGAGCWGDSAARGVAASC